MGYSAATEKRLADEEEIREKYPEHSCWDVLEVGDMLAGQYVGKEDAQYVLAERDALADRLREIIEAQRWDRLVLDEYDLIALEQFVNKNTSGMLD